jgi:hypothetical protein
MLGKTQNQDPRQPWTRDENGKLVEAKLKYDYDEEMENSEDECCEECHYYMILGD